MAMSIQLNVFNECFSNVFPSNWAISRTVFHLWRPKICLPWMDRNRRRVGTVIQLGCLCRGIPHFSLVQLSVLVPVLVFRCLQHIKYIKHKTIKMLYVDAILCTHIIWCNVIPNQFCNAPEVRSCLSRRAIFRGTDAFALWIVVDPSQCARAQLFLWRDETLLMVTHYWVKLRWAYEDNKNWRYWCNHMQSDSGELKVLRLLRRDIWHFGLNLIGESSPQYGNVSTCSNREYNYFQNSSSFLFSGCFWNVIRGRLFSKGSFSRVTKTKEIAAFLLPTQVIL